MRAIPETDPAEDSDADHGREREPGDVELAVGDHQQRHQQRADRLPGIAADLEHRLGEPVTPAGGEPRHARRLGVEHRAADADQSRDQQHGGEAAGHRQQQHADEGRGHPERQRERLRVLVGVEPDHRLQNRGGQLEGQRDDPDVHEIERQRLLEQRIDRQQRRLHRVVEEVPRTDREENWQHRRARDPCPCRRACAACRHDALVSLDGVPPKKTCTGPLRSKPEFQFHSGHRALFRAPVARSSPASVSTSSVPRRARSAPGTSVATATW